MLSPLAEICVSLYDDNMLDKNNIPPMVREEVLAYLNNREEVNADDESESTSTSMYHTDDE